MENKEPENKPEEKKDETAPETAKAPEEEKKDPLLAKYEQQISFLQADQTKLKEEAESWKNKYYLAYADLANTRKTLEKDHETAIRYRSQGFIERILPTLDSFEMAAKAKSDNPEVKKYAEGFNMIHTQLEQALKEEGVSFVEPKVGEKFSSDSMHAIQTVDGPEDNLIAAVYVKGYKLHDRLIRPSMVVVTKKPAEPLEEKKEDAQDAKKEEDKK